MHYTSNCTTFQHEYSYLFRLNRRNCCYAHINVFTTQRVNITFNKITPKQYKNLAFFRLNVLEITMLHIAKPIVKTENTVNLKSLALKGMFNILVCVEGTQPHPNISTKIEPSNIM